MEITNSHKHYLLICEIGPIWDFTRQSRKTVDFWGASFIFSYIMSEIAIKLKKNHGATIFLPYLDDNPMFKRDGSPIYCGSVPDQIYIVVGEAKRGPVIEALRDIIHQAVGPIVEGIGKHLRKISADEITDYFNFFYIIHPLSGEKPTYEEFIEAERKIKMRASFRPFKESEAGNVIPKWDKCNRCGERPLVTTITVDSNGTLFDEERICGICSVRRFLPKTVKALLSGIVDPSYESTSDIAAQPVKSSIEFLKSLSGYGALKTALIDAIDTLKNEHRKKMEAEFQVKFEKRMSDDLDLDYGRAFYDTAPDILRHINTFRTAFKAFEKEAIADGHIKTHKHWLDRPFYSIVYMDGDNMGSILKAEQDKFPGYLSNVSRLISKFSNGVNEVVSRYDGQLIFAGGEDINFIIHPEYLLDCIKELQCIYNKLFIDEPLTKIIAEKFTLSAGAIVCYHKYPLSQAIMRAGEMMREAKRYPGKNATALLLIKGHTETLQLAIPNSLIGSLLKLKAYFLDSDISRTTPYRIEEAKSLLDSISDSEMKKRYLKMILKGTRGKGREDDKLNELAERLLEFSHTDTMINALLYARFLAGDK